MKYIDREFVQRWGTAGVWVYFTFLFGWVLFYLVAGDRIAYLALLNNLAVYLFFPLIGVIAWGFYVRRKDIWAGSFLGSLVFFWLWGGLFLPRSLNSDIDSPVLSVMTYNILGRHNQYEPLAAVIQTEDPDVVFLQELNPQIAAAFAVELGEKYPYQVFDPRAGVTGMGVMSKFPLQDSDRRLPLDWVGVPQVLLMAWEGRTITLINFHFYPSGLGTPSGVNYVFRAREAQAHALAEAAAMAALDGPVLVGGDANVTDLSTAYRIMTGELHDAWRETGFGLGHTFPGSSIPGSARPRVAGYPVPKWLARIDYVLYSDHWIGLSSRLAPFDRVSDHRGVLTELTLK